MAKRNVKTKPLPEPTFIEQANAIIDESYAVKIDEPIYGHALQPRDHKLLVKIMDLHVKYVYDTMITSFMNEIAAHYKPIMRKLEELETGQSEIKEDLQAMNAQVASNTGRIEQLEKDVNALHPAAIRQYAAEIAEIRPVLLKIVGAFKWWKLVIYIAVLAALGLIVHQIFLI